MYIIFGLGNPGPQYEMTRHNVGYMVLDELVKRYDVLFKRGNGPFEASACYFNDHQILFVKPLTFMNLSGEAVSFLIDEYNFHDYSKLLVVLDDINLPFGTIRLRPYGSDGGQKGLRSIIDALEDRGIPRLRIGIGDNFSDAVDYVLSPFTAKEREDLPLILKHAVDAVESFIEEGIGLTMSRYNRNFLDQ
ncbi:MAG: aminoacyl-tRNA hydrolase [Calditrichia bacterium]